MGFKRAKSARDAEWVETALGEGDFSRVSSVVPARFEAYAAVLNPAWKCVCGENEVNPEYDERPGEPIRWTDVADAQIPVVYGRTHHYRFGRFWSNPTQYRRLEDGNWIVDELVGINEVTPLLRAGDEWIAGPMEDTPSLEQVSFLKNVLSAVTPAAESCWFGIWEGYGWSPEVLSGAVSICIRSDRPWLLYRAPLSELTTSIDTIDDSRGASGAAYVALEPAFEARTAPADWTIQQGRIRWKTRYFPKDIVNWIKWRRRNRLTQRGVFRMTGIRRLGLARRIAVWLMQRKRKV